MKVDPLLLGALMTLALVLGALLTMVAYKGMIAQVVSQQLKEEIHRRAEIGAELNNAA